LSDAKERTGEKTTRKEKICPALDGTRVPCDIMMQTSMVAYSVVYGWIQPKQVNDRRKEKMQRRRQQKKNDGIVECPELNTHGSKKEEKKSDGRKSQGH